MTIDAVALRSEISNKFRIARTFESATSSSDPLCRNFKMCVLCKLRVHKVAFSNSFNISYSLDLYFVQVTHNKYRTRYKTRLVFTIADCSTFMQFTNCLYKYEQWRINMSPRMEPQIPAEKCSFIQWHWGNTPFVTQFSTAPAFRWKDCMT